MPCFFCGSHEDSISLRIRRNGKKQTISLCSLCAAERGILQEKTELHIDLDDLLRAMEDDPMDKESSNCPSCGMSRETIMLTGLCACPECYNFFREDLLLLREEAESHPGIMEKLVKQQKIQSLLKSLKRELNQFVELEDYEGAADMRDRISRLKANLETNHES